MKIFKNKEMSVIFDVDSLVEIVEFKMNIVKLKK